MLTKSARIRLIINAGERNLAQKIADEIITNISGETTVTVELSRYEDDYHYEISFSIELTSDNFSELEHKAFKLCTTISMGPWIYINLPNYESEFEFEAIFNHEAFIHHPTEYNNKLKWAHLETN